MFDLSYERKMARSLSSQRWGLVFLAALPFWMLLPNYVMLISPEPALSQAFALLVATVACAFTTLLSTYKLERDTMPWATLRVFVFGFLLIVLAVTLLKLQGQSLEGALADGTPTILGVIGYAGGGLFYATIFALVAFIVFYLRHGPSGRGSIEDGLLDDDSPEHE